MHGVYHVRTVLGLQRYRTVMSHDFSILYSRHKIEYNMLMYTYILHTFYWHIVAKKTIFHSL
jgi:hypothetical protein